MRIKTSLTGYSLLIAIVVVIVITTFSLLLLTFFSINSQIISTLKKKQLSTLYALRGLDIISSDEYAYGNEIVSDLDNYTVVTYKKRWGAFDVNFCAILEGNDTLTTKVALVGYELDTSKKIALYISNTDASLYVSDSVNIEGDCFVPKGLVKYIQAKKRLAFGQVFPSEDTLPSIKGYFLFSWIDSFYTTNSMFINAIDDSLSKSFFENTLCLQGDEVMINANLKGNIVVKADRISVKNNVELNDVILIARMISFPDSFNGNLQAYATDSIITGKHCAFQYPTVLAVISKVDSIVRQRSKSVCIISDSSTISGEIYAISKDGKYDNSALIIKNNCKVTGNIYCTGALTWSGDCDGTIFCNKILYKDRFTINENYLYGTTINIKRLKNYFGCSFINCNYGKKKIIQWCD